MDKSHYDEWMSVYIECFKTSMHGVKLILQGMTKFFLSQNLSNETYAEFYSFYDGNEISVCEFHASGGWILKKKNCNFFFGHPNYRRRVGVKLHSLFIVG